MKPLLSIILLILPCTIIFGQSGAGKELEWDFFAPRKTSYTLQQTGYYGNVKNRINGQERGHSNDTYIDLEATHWLGKGFGVGLAMEGDWSGSHYNGNDLLSRSWTISPSLAYGKTLNDHWGVFARGEFTLGQDKDIYKSATTSSTDKADLSGFNFTVGFPYRFSKYTAITTTLDYDYSKTKGDSYHENQNLFGLNFFLEDYIACSQIKCDARSGFKLSKDKYDQGSGFLDYDTKASFYTGNTTTDYNALPQSSKNKLSGQSIGLKGSYYVIDYAAIGAGLSYDHSSQKSDDNVFNTINSSFRFTPEIIINTPVDNGWRNLFFKAEGQWGENKLEITSSGTGYKQKLSVSGFNAGIGYYAFFAEKTALKTCIYYQSTTKKDSDANEKSKASGLGIQIGLSHAF